jgi:hypothetical protein
MAKGATKFAFVNGVWKGKENEYRNLQSGAGLALRAKSSVVVEKEGRE